MAGADKYHITNDLISKGWVEVENNVFRPPQSLWDNRPATFSIYDARDLQDELGELTDDTKDRIARAHGVEKYEDIPDD